jgi:FkbM family methyltransferase
MRTATRYLNLITRVANWPAYFLAKFGWRHVDPMTFRLRSGDVAEVPLSCLGEFKQIFFSDLYTRGLARPVGGGDIIDVGANVGCFTLFAASELHSRRVIAFEPDPKNFQQLAKNVALNPRHKITAVQEAVGRSRGEVTFFNDASAEFTIGGTLLSDRGERRGYSTIRVKSTTLADIFERFGIDRCSLLKLDCEGAEFDILETSPEEVCDRIDQIAMEVHEMPGRSMESIVARLRHLGFDSRREGPILWAWRKNGQR